MMYILEKKGICFPEKVPHGQEGTKTKTGEGREIFSNSRRTWGEGKIFVWHKI